MRKLSALIRQIETKACLHYKDHAGILPLDAISKAYALEYGATTSLWDEATKYRFSQTIKEAIEESNSNYRTQLEEQFR